MGMPRETIPPADTGAYNEKLRASLVDKLFFMQHLGDKVGLWVDFGCADGAVLRAVRNKTFFQNQYVGYDSDPVQIMACRANGIPATSDRMAIARLFRCAKQEGHKSVLILSSVIHELRSQGMTLASIMDMVADWDPDYVVIRDFALDEHEYDVPVPLGNITKVREHTHPDERWEFISRYGRIETRAEMIHFLLKYQFATDTEDWEKELQEDYIGTSAQVYDRLGEFHGYHQLHYDHSPLPHFQRWVRKVFGFELTSATHVKLILERT